MRQYVRQLKLSTTKAEEANIEPVRKKESYYFIWINRVRLLSAVLLHHKLTFLFIFQTFLKLTTSSFTFNPMEFTVSNNEPQ